MILGMSFTNNNNHRNPNAIQMPAFLTNLNYYSKSGLWTSANYTKYFGAPENTFEIEFDLGYQKTLFDNLDVDLQYTHHIFRGDLAYEGISYSNSVSLSGDYRLRNFSLSLDNEYMIGDNNNYFLDFGLSYDIEVSELLTSTDYLGFSPSLITSFGTTYWIPDTMEHVWGNHAGSGHMGVYTPENPFDYQRMSLILPLLYSIRSFTFSVGWYYSIPSKTLKEQNWTNQSGAIFSLIFTPIL